MIKRSIHVKGYFVMVVLMRWKIIVAWMFPKHEHVQWYIRGKAV